MRNYMHNSFKRLIAWFDQLWYGRWAWHHVLLFPVLYVFSLFYQLGFRLLKRKPVLNNRVPVIIVGNLTVGGSGKTPCVIALVKLLKQWGFEPGVITRGYGGSGPCVAELINSNSDPRIVGDEPVLIAQVTGCPVVVDPVRARGVRALELLCDIVISDDGLQHSWLARDLEIVIINGQRQFGNGYCLPAGPLREPMTRLDTVDMMITVDGEGEFSAKTQAGKLHSLTGDASLDLDALPFLKIHAVAGIAHPEQFFQILRPYVDLVPHAYPDHYNYQAADVDFKNPYPIVTTAKDAVKLNNIKREGIWVLDWSVSFDQACEQQLLKFLQKLATESESNNNYRAEHVCSLLTKVRKLS